jgi:transcription elongation GreA/GreB family factor
VTKSKIVQEILAQLDAELELSAKSARSAHEEATNEQSKAENKYDTRGLEASYLARGQSLKAAETVQAHRLFQELRLHNFAPGEEIDLSALVELDGEDGRVRYFVGPAAGGSEVGRGKTAILVITPQSPFGRQLVGRKAGERFEITLAGAKRSFQIVSVS